jgi:hypothetical protein
MNRQSDVNISPDEQMDAALRIVSDCGVPAGLVDRVRERVHATAESEAPGTLRWVRVPAVVGVAAAILVAVLLSLHSRPVERVDVANLSSAAAVQTLSSHATAVVQPAHLQETESGRVLKAERHHGKTVARRHSANLLNYPLTKQERLLVQFAQTASPEELQILNPQYQAKVEAQQEAEFVAYIHSADNSGAQGTQEAANQTTPE